MERIMTKCAGCNNFHYEDEMETVTIKLIKHPDCTLDTIVKSQTAKPIVESFERTIDSDMDLIKNINSQHGKM